MLSDPFYTFAFESIYISCQGFVKEQWAGFPFIWAYVTFTSLTSFLWGPTWFRKVSGYQLFQCPVLGGSQQCNPTKSKTKWMKWPFEHTQSNIASMLENQCVHLQQMQWQWWKKHKDQTDICILMQNKSYQCHWMTKQSYCVQVQLLFCLYISDRLLT